MVAGNITFAVTPDRGVLQSRSLSLAVWNVARFKRVPSLRVLTLEFVLFSAKSMPIRPEPWCHERSLAHPTHHDAERSISRSYLHTTPVSCWRHMASVPPSMLPSLSFGATPAPTACSAPSPVAFSISAGFDEELRSLNRPPYSVDCSVLLAFVSTLRNS